LWNNSSVTSRRILLLLNPIMKRPMIIFLLVLFVGSVFLIHYLDRTLTSSSETEIKSSSDESLAVMSQGASSEPLPDSNFKISMPLAFPVVGMNREMILDIRDSRLPGAPRTYRGANARHQGIDFYTGKCDIPVVAVADGWIIDVSVGEQFPNAARRNAILDVALKAGFTPSPILENLNGGSLLIYHGWNDSGVCYYSRSSHFERLFGGWKIGDFVRRGEIIGYVGASGTSSQFKSKDEKKIGCHLHFEWHEVSGGEDNPLGFDERDNDLKRNLYYNLFESDGS